MAGLIEKIFQISFKASGNPLAFLYLKLTLVILLEQSVIYVIGIQLQKPLYGH